MSGQLPRYKIEFTTGMLEGYDGTVAFGFKVIDLWDDGKALVNHTVAIGAGAPLRFNDVIVTEQTDLTPFPAT